MLRANVGLSRKVSKDYNSTGYSINLDGEILAPVSDPEAVFEQVKELFDLAEEVLNQQIDRSQSEAAIASHDEQPQRSPANQNSNGNAKPNRNPPRQAPSSESGNANSNANGNSHANGNGHASDKSVEPATNKQIQYLLSIGKRQKLSTAQLEKKIAEIVGRPVGVYDLSKMAAGIVIDALTKGTTSESAARQ